MSKKTEPQGLTRRHFLQTTAAGLGVGLVGVRPVARALSAEEAAAEAAAAESFSFALVADMHYAEIPPQGIRVYRDSLKKLQAAVEALSQRELAFAVELGDFIDLGPTKAEALEYLDATRDAFAELKCPRHFVLGNHCIDQLTKEEFLANCGAESRESYYSFDSGRYHFAVLDANFGEDGTPHAPGDRYSWDDASIHEAQRQWLAEDLEKARDKKSILFVHQVLGEDGIPESIDNAPQVRAILEEAGNVLAVFHGHKHSGGYSKIGGIHYCTLRAMVEGRAPASNAYAVVTLRADNHITLEGFGRQPDVEFK